MCATAVQTQIAATSQGASATRASALDLSAQWLDCLHAQLGVGTVPTGGTSLKPYSLLQRCVKQSALWMCYIPWHVGCMCMIVCGCVLWVLTTSIGNSAVAIALSPGDTLWC